MNHLALANLLTRTGCFQLDCATETLLISFLIFRGKTILQINKMSKRIFEALSRLSASYLYCLLPKIRVIYSKCWCVSHNFNLNIIVRIRVFNNSTANKQSNTCSCPVCGNVCMHLCTCWIICITSATITERLNGKAINYNRTIDVRALLLLLLFLLMV